MEKQTLLQLLDLASPGLSKKDLVEQSSCFVFDGNQLKTFNNEVACFVPTPFKLKGAVAGYPLLKTLPKINSDELELQINNGHLLLRTKRQKIGLNLERSVRLPIDEVEQPTEWKTLPDGLSDAIAATHGCAGKNENEFVLMCMHFHPNFIETCDRHQLVRYHIKLPIDGSFLIRSSAAKFISNCQMEEVGETEAWVHFRNPEAQYAFRKYSHTFPQLDSLMNVEGSSIEFPEELFAALANAKVFSSEETSDLVLVDLRKGKLRIVGEGLNGFYEERFKTEYAGRELKFYIPPKLFREILKRSTTCVVDLTRLFIQGDDFLFISTLSTQK